MHIYIILYRCIAARAGDTTKNYKDHNAVTAAAEAEPNIEGIINIQYYYYYDIRHNEIVYSTLHVVLNFIIHYNIIHCVRLRCS